MRKIELTKGQVALIDDGDYEELMKYAWSALWNKNAQKFYVKRNGYIDGKRCFIMMHRLILGLTDPKVQCDHKDGNGLNNQRYNLRIVTNQQNQFNQKKQKNCSSKYKGVYWSKNHQKWRAKIQVDKTSKHIGYFDQESDAALAYDQTAMQYFGSFAKLNMAP